MRLLVVGGGGFLGRNVVARGRELGWEVTSMSLHPRAESGRGDLAIGVDVTDAGAVQTALGNQAFDYVVNCGGYVDHTAFARGGRAAMDAHFIGVLNIVEAVDRASLRAFINIGSSDEYGAAPAPQAEWMREAPISPYSAGKTAACHFLQMLHRTEQFPATTLRLFLTYGPGQDTNRFLPQVVLGCLADRKFPVSSGVQLRDFCFIDDVVDAIFATLEEGAARGAVINVASGKPVTIRAVVDMVRSIVGRGEPDFGAIPARAGENMELFADVSTAASLLRWAPGVDLEEGIARVIRSLAERR